MKAKYGNGYSGGYLGMPFGFALHCLTLKSGGAKSLLTGCEKTLLSNGNAATVANTGGGMLELTLPWPPKDLSPNARVHWAKLAIAKKAYRFDCAMLAMEQGAKPMQGPVSALITFYPPDKRQRDWDNQIASIKSLIDGVSDAIKVNDRDFRMTFAFSDQIGGMVKVKVATV